MKLLGIVGSMRKNRCTNTLVLHCIDSVRKLSPEVESEILYTLDYKIDPCAVTCSRFCSDHPFKCTHEKDDLQKIMAKMIEADALIIGAPLYVKAPPAHFHTFVEKMTSLFYFNECSELSSISPLNEKPCGLVAVAEYSNPYSILEYLQDFCLLLKMRPLTLKSFPYLGVAGQGDLTKDQVFKPFRQSELLAQLMVEALK